MIEYIKGELTDLTPAMATVEAAGVGYGLNISLTTYSACQGKKEVKLYVYEAIREDAYVLYGFYNKKEREMFELLITVSGVGANTARMMLSGMSVSELCSAISTGNAKLIQGIKGIGKMTAQRIIVDLRDKIVALGIAEEIPAGGRGRCCSYYAGICPCSDAKGRGADTARPARITCRTGGEVGFEADKITYLYGKNGRRCNICACFALF